MSEEDSKVIQTQVDVGIIKSTQIETNRRLSNIESKMDSFAFTKQVDFDEFRKYVADNFVTQQEFKPMSRIVWGVVIALITGITVAGLNLLLRKP